MPRWSSSAANPPYISTAGAAPPRLRVGAVIMGELLPVGIACCILLTSISPWPQTTARLCYSTSPSLLHAMHAVGHGTLAATSKTPRPAATHAIDTLLDLELRDKASSTALRHAGGQQVRMFA